jgi:hypothetical protein
MFGDVQTAAKLMVKVGADVQEAQHKLNGMSKEFDMLKQAGTKMAMGVTVAVAAVGAATVAFAAKAIAAGSDLEESQNKARVVFGQSAAAIEQWSKGSAQALAMTQQQALEASATFGNLFTSMGLAIQPATEMSKGLVQLAADLASFNNLNVDEALLKLQSGLVGETEPLRALGVNLSAATTQAEALKMGLAANVEALTAADLAQARYALILQQTTAAQGDLARTSDGWANQNRILQATLANMTAEIGTKLLPVVNSFLQQLVDFVQNSGPAIVATVGTIVTSFQSMVTAIGQVDFSAVTAQFEGLKQSIGVDFWAQVFGFIGQQIALTVTNFQELGFELSSIGEQFKAFGEFLKGDASWSEYRERMKELQVEYDAMHAAFQTTYDEINGRDWGEAVAALNAVSEANSQATDWWQRHAEALRAVNDDTSTASDALLSLADVWTQAYQAIQDATATGMDNSRLKVLQTFNGMAQDYAQHATTIVDLENRKGQMVAYLESVYQQQAAAYTAAGQTAQLGVLTQAHNAKLKAVLASYNTQIKLEGSGQTALLSNAKKYYLTTLSMMAKALIAQVAVVKANMMAMVRMIVSGYGSAAAAAYAFNKIKDGMADIGSIQAAMAEVMSAFDAIEGTGISAITEASDAFKDWKADIGDVADGLGNVGDELGNVGDGAKDKLIDPLEAAARVVEGIGQMVQRAIDAFNTLAKWGGPQAGWVDKFNLLAAALVTMVQKWAAAVEKIMPLLEEDKRNAIMQFSDMVRSVMSALQSAITVMSALEEYEGVFEVSAEAVSNILNFVKDMANRFAVIAKTFKEEVLVQVKAFTETAISVMKLISDAITALMRLEDYDLAIGTIAKDVIDQIVLMTKYLVDAFGKIADDFTDLVLNDLKKFADGAGAVLKLIGDAVGSLLKLKDFASTDRFYSLSNELIKQIHYLVVSFGELAALVDKDLREEAQKFAAAAGPVLKLIGDAVGSLLKLKDFASTSRFYSLSNELIKQIIYLVDSFGQVGALVDEDLLEAAQKFAAAAGPVMKAVGDAVGALMAFKDYDKSMSVASAGAENLVQQIASFVRKLSRLGGQLGGPALEAAKAFAATAGPVVKLVGDAIENLMKFKDYDKNFSLANAGADLLVQQIGAFVRKLARLGGQLGGPALDAAKDFAATAGPVINLIGDAIEGLMKFKDYDKNFNLHNAGAGKIVDQIAAFVRKFVRLGQAFGQPALLAAQQFAEAAADVVSTLSDALDLLTKIKTYVGPSGNALLAFERDVEDMLLRFTRWVVFVIQPIAAGIDSDAMQAMEDMVNGLSAALELLTGLVDYVSPSAAALTAFMDGVQQLAEDFFEWAHTNGPQLFKEIPPEFLAAFRDVFEGLAAAVDVLTALVDFVAPSVMAVMSFEEGYQRLFMDWLTWVQNNLGQTKNDLLIAIAEVFQQVMDGLATAVTVLTGLIDFVAPSVMQVMAFEEGYQRLFLDWVTWATGTFEDLNTELVAAVASVFGDVFNGIGAAVATLVAISGYVSPGLAAIMAFEADYQRLFAGFVTWVETTFTDISTDLVVAMTGAASALFQGLGAAATTLAQITGYVGPTEATIVAFEADYQRLATGFRTWAESSWTAETAAATTAVGNAINALYQGLGTAATTLSLIRNYTAPAQAVVNQFITDMTSVITTMLTWAQTSFGVDAQALMTSFGTTVGTLFTGLGTALNVLQGIAAYTVPDSQFILALQRFNANLLTAITSWQIWLTNTFTPETAALVAQFHTILSGIVADMGAALQLLMDIDQANLPTADELIAFLDAVAQLFNGVIAVFGTLTGTLSTLVVNMATTFANMFAMITTAVSGFSDTLFNELAGLFTAISNSMWAWGNYAAGMFLSGMLAGMQNVNSVNAVVNAMRDLAEQLEAELRAAWGLHSPSRVAMGIGEMFVAGLSLGLRDLAGIPSMIQSQLAMGDVTLGADVRFSPAPRHDRLTIEFQGAYQAGMSPAEEKRITQAMVGELRRQGVALQVARV